VFTSLQEGNPLSLPAQSENFLSWYIIHTASRHEVKVADGLTKKSLEVFLPRVMVRSRRQDRFRMLEMPLFPGYLFVHTDLGFSDYDCIIRQDGVVPILGITGHFTPVPEETVASIRTLANSGLLIFPWAKLETGKRVRVVDGPLVGAVGIICG